MEHITQLKRTNKNKTLPLKEYYKIKIDSSFYIDFKKKLREDKTGKTKSIIINQGDKWKY